MAFVELLHDLLAVRDHLEFTEKPMPPSMALDRSQMLGGHGLPGFLSIAILYAQVGVEFPVVNLKVRPIGVGDHLIHVHKYDHVFFFVKYFNTAQNIKLWGQWFSTKH